MASGRDKDGDGTPRDGASGESCPWPLPTDRRERLQALAELARKGLYQPDLDALAMALLDREPGLFHLPEKKDS